MAFGLTENGLVIKSLDDIKTDAETRLKEAFGEINTDAASVFGQLIGVLSEVASEVWQELENVYQNQYPSGANGISLDNAVAYNAITRLEATRSLVDVVLFGTQGTLVETGTRVSTAETNNVFFTTSDVTIDAAFVVESEVTVDTVANTFSYTVTINGTPYTYISDSDATEDEITAGLESAINASSDVVATDNQDGTVKVVSVDSKTTFSIVAGANLSLSRIGTPSESQSFEKGEISAPAGTITIIDTPVSGLDEVNNLLDATIGIPIETDQGLRNRRLNSLSVPGASTLDAMFSNILNNVPDVTDVTVTDDDVAHTISVIVSGGTDLDVAEEIFRVKPAGIELLGTTSVPIVDSQGNTQTIKFTRPTDKYAHVKVDLTLSTEEQFPTNGEDQVSDNILAFGETFNSGQDMIHKAFYTPVFDIAGIADAEVYIDLTTNPGDTPSYVQTNIAVAATEIARFASSRIDVSIP